MQTNTNIREANTSDYQIIADIYNEYITLGTSNMEETPKTTEAVANWVANFNHREKLYVYTKDEKVIGWGIIKRYSDREGYRFACETAVYFTQTELGKGYGTQMKKFVIVQCKKLDYKHLVAKVFATNTASIAYNEKLGYTIVGRQHQIGFRNGQWVDMIIMQYVFE
ncbi:phosphinothricin acetyltransferase [Kordia periserrulae]|uniref:Phosphinothricin acetyltransferase n=1 Tax=Kordia periserrulae TaxID=701523 RepID=A0A2T6C338_9FLAO|nr:GNAT family N-acetyltransferase [Kordia periserrulae]PTX62742.1 phosphinothricin acetyltransferase [Kordia periserrulae]